MILRFALPIAPAGKERPRVTKFGTFMPKAYNVWRDKVRFLIRSKIPAEIADRLPLVSRLSWSVTYSVPSGDMKPDGDNADGALWDAIQVPKKGGWGLIANDKQFKKWAGEVIAGPTCIRFQIEELP